MARSIFLGMPLILPAMQLDIDNWQVEQALMDQIRAETALQAMISEMFFEQHFTNPAVRNARCKHLCTCAGSSEWLIFDVMRTTGFHLNASARYLIRPQGSQRL